MENFLVDFDRVNPEKIIIKLTDFGCSTYFNPTEMCKPSNKVGTVITMAPEMIK